MKSGYIEGVIYDQCGRDYSPHIEEPIRLLITLKGLEYLSDNTIMNEIRRLLYKYLNTDAIKVIGMGEKIEDVQWLIKNGYQEDFKTIRGSEACFKMYGDITQKGKVFFKRYEKEFIEYYEKSKSANVLTIENKDKTRKLIRNYVKNNRKVDFSLNSKALSGLTEDEKYAFMYFKKDPLDMGKR